MTAIFVLQPKSTSFEIASTCKHAKSCVCVLPNLPSTPPPQWRPLEINNPRTFGVADLPKGTNRGSLIALFNLFFNAKVIEQITHFTNDRAAHAHPQLPSARGWKPTSPGELYTYFAIVVYMAVHREPSLAEYWSRGHKNAPTHKLNDFMGCTRWHQLDRYLYTAEVSQTFQSPFSRVWDLSELLRARSLQY
ncbi:hypothetical protein BU23DRAFT_499557 [Bimuria novae-zelandiae CBS 107.79]|uniref:PiggyBac transposable element-derived protein domain-containing protein n=1 Tax=Bimuria novae-zelandiae CBS 107.79 TaxID=1447943 RepID=A0A6A5VMB2_9PLEO|nr:hypothetical protein BU23DRAFT_499557 [Bimuria novae-zelandiae CBS 107.79]